MSGRDGGLAYEALCEVGSLASLLPTSGRAGRLSGCGLRDLACGSGKPSLERCVVGVFELNVVHDFKRHIMVAGSCGSRGCCVCAVLFCQAPGL